MSTTPPRFEWSVGSFDPLAPQQRPPSLGEQLERQLRLDKEAEEEWQLAASQEEIVKKREEQHAIDAELLRERARETKRMKEQIRQLKESAVAKMKLAAEEVLPIASAGAGSDRRRESTSTSAASREPFARPLSRASSAATQQINPADDRHMDSGEQTPARSAQPQRPISGLYERLTSRATSLASSRQPQDTRVSSIRAQATPLQHHTGATMRSVTLPTDLSPQARASNARADDCMRILKEAQTRGSGQSARHTEGATATRRQLNQIEQNLLHDGRRTQREQPAKSLAPLRPPNFVADETQSLLCDSLRLKVLESQEGHEAALQFDWEDGQSQQGSIVGGQASEATGHPPSRLEDEHAMEETLVHAPQPSVPMQQNTQARDDRVASPSGSQHDADDRGRDAEEALPSSEAIDQQSEMSTVLARRHSHETFLGVRRSERLGAALHKSMDEKLLYKKMSANIYYDGEKSSTGTSASEESDSEEEFRLTQSNDETQMSFLERRAAIQDKISSRAKGKRSRKTV